MTRRITRQIIHTTYYILHSHHHPDHDHDHHGHDHDHDDPGPGPNKKERRGPARGVMTM